MESVLPFEILCEILSYLDVENRLIASLVCRRWLQACSTQLGDVCLNLDPRRRKPPQTPLPPLPLMRPFSKVTLLKMDINQQCVDFLNYLGPQLLHLVVIDCNMVSCGIEIKCPQLRTLVTDSADIVTALAPSMEHLQSLNLLVAKDASDYLLGWMDTKCPNLREFKVPRSVAFDRRVAKRFYPNCSIPPSPFVLTTRAVETFIAKRAATLTSLHLPPDIPADAALRIASTPGLALTDVNICDCNGLVGSLGEFFKMQPRVVALKLLGVKLEYEELETVVRLLPGLRMLSASCDFDKQQALALVFRLRHLRRLCIRSPQFRHKIPPEAFSMIASVDLRFLDVGYCLDNESIQRLLERAPALRELKMGITSKKFFRDGPNIRTIHHQLIPNTGFPLVFENP